MAGARIRAVGSTDFAIEINGMAARSIALLSAIEKTVSALCGNTEALNFLTTQASSLVEIIANSDWTSEIDPNGALALQLTNVSDRLKRDYTDAIARRQAARDDPALTSDDGVEDAYTAFIASLADLNNLIEELRDVMQTIDAQKSPTTGKQYTNVDDLFADIDS